MFTGRLPRISGAACLQGIGSGSSLFGLNLISFMLSKLSQSNSTPYITSYLVRCSAIEGGRHGGRQRERASGRERWREKERGKEEPVAKLA